MRAGALSVAEEESRGGLDELALERLGISIEKRQATVKNIMDYFIYKCKHKTSLRKKLLNKSLLYSVAVCELVYGEGEGESIN